jgi:hypothetical protein
LLEEKEIGFLLHVHLPRLWFLVLWTLFRFVRLVARLVFGTAVAAVEEKDGEEKVLATSTVATIKASVAIAVLVVVVVTSMISAILSTSCGGGVWSGR